MYGSSWHPTTFNGIRSSLTERTCLTQWHGIWRAAARKTMKDVGARGFVEMRRLASMGELGKKTLALTRLDIRQPTGSSIEDTNCHGHCWMRSVSGELASLELPDHSLEFGRRNVMVVVAFETMDTSHRLRRALLAGVRESSHTQGVVTGELFFSWAKSQEEQNRRADSTCYPSVVCGPATVVGKEKNNLFCVLSWSSDECCTGMLPKCKRC